jgi:hypothetical protein
MNKTNIESSLLSLESFYVSDFLNENEKPRGGKYSLDIILDETINAPRLKTVAPSGVMYGKYWYRSGINNSMKIELQNIVETIRSRFKLVENDIWLDIACNDGTLLSYVPKLCIRVGIDPADNSYVQESKQYANAIIQDYFSLNAWQKTLYAQQKAKIITSIAVFYDLDDPISFVNDIKKVLSKDGMWVLQLSYTPLMLKQLAFDNICHEHVYYYSVENLKILFEKCEMEIVDVELNDVNGGSFRVFVMNKEADKTKYGTAPLRDVAAYRIDSILQYEKLLNLTSKETWKNFKSKIDDLKEEVVSFIKEAKKNGKTVWGYGASTKGNTLLQYFGLDCNMIDAIAERSPYKWGLKTVGTNIPIKSEADMRIAQPDYLLVLPWHFISEFIEREKDYLGRGGKFIVPCPNFKIITL